MLLSLLLLFAFAPAAEAACTSPAGVAGQFQYISADFKYCNGTTWNSMAAAAPSGSCSVAGQLLVSGGAARYCNGTNLVSMDGSEINGTCAAGATGTIRYSSANSWMEWCNGTNWKVMRTASSGSPTISSLSLTGAIGLGGSSSTTVTGTNFASGAVVAINGTPCTSTTFVSATQLTCAVPSSGSASTIAKVNVTVTNPDAQVATLTNGFTYLGAPRLWMKADAGITITSGKVSAWADSSGSGVVGTGWAAANNPTLVNSASFGGKPVVSFAGNHIIDIGDAFAVPRNIPGLTSVAAARITGASSSWIWVFQNSGNNDTRVGLGVGTPPGTNVGTSASGDVFFAGRRLQANAINYLQGGSAGGAAFTAAATVDFVSRAGTLNFNGSTVSTTSTFSTGGGNTNNADSLNGGIGSNDGYDYFQGEIAEFLIYGTALSASETTIVEQYVRAKYSMP